MNWITQFGPTALIIIGAILSLIGAVWSQTQSAQQSNEILSLNRQITETVTGGDSYPIAVPVYTAPHGEQGEIKNIYLKSSGKYPIYDLVVIITDMIAFEKEKGKAIPNQNAYMWKETVGTIGRGYEEKLLSVPSQYTSHIDYRFTYIARNGQVTQRVVYVKKDGKWLTGTRLFKNNALIYETFAPGFPVDSFPKEN